MIHDDEHDIFTTRYRNSNNSIQEVFKFYYYHNKGTITLSLHKITMLSVYRILLLLTEINNITWV